MGERKEYSQEKKDKSSRSKKGSGSSGKTSRKSRGKSSGSSSKSPISVSGCVVRVEADTKLAERLKSVSETVAHVWRCYDDVRAVLVVSGNFGTAGERELKAALKQCSRIAVVGGGERGNALVKKLSKAGRFSSEAAARDWIREGARSHPLRVDILRNPPDLRVGPQMRVLVVGGGIAGLTIAGQLLQRGFRPVVVERVKTYLPRGYAICVWPLAVDALKSLGLYEEFCKISHPLEAYRLYNMAGKHLSNVDLEPLNARGRTMRVVERSHLLSLLATKIPGELLRMGTTVEEITQTSDLARVRFTDGSTGEFDVVIGADGVKSSVRTMVFDDSEGSFMGLRYFTFWVDVANLNDESKAFVADINFHFFWGSGNFLGIFPMVTRIACFIAFTCDEKDPVDAKTRIKRMQSRMKGFGPFVQDLLKNLPKPDMIFENNGYHLRERSWSMGRVVLLGDACAPVQPTSGAGASMAMESSIVLADMLARSDSRLVSHAFYHYQRRRYSRIKFIQQEGILVAMGIRLGGPAPPIRNLVTSFSPGTLVSKFLLRLVEKPA